MVKIVLISLMLLMSGCAGTYQAGDLSRAYCATVDPQARAVLRATLINAGVQVPIDYCLTYGLVDALAKQGQ